MDGGRDRRAQGRAVRRAPLRRPDHGIREVAAMAAMTELKGTELGTTKVKVESGPVKAFAQAIKDPNPEYQGDAAIVPPTFPFVWGYWGTIGGGSKGLPIDNLGGKGRMILHGEQEFDWHRNGQVGDVLEGTGRISVVYEKDTSSALMDFYVMETSWKDAACGEPVVDVKFTLIIRDTGVKQQA